jgi:hypothetical protein
MMHLAEAFFLLSIPAILLLYLIDRLLCWLESRGWIHYRKIKPRQTMRAGFNAFQQFVEPQIVHIIEDREQRNALESDEQGAPPGPKASK